MKRGLLAVVAAMVLLGTVGGGAVYAQEIAIVNVPFEFTVNNKVMPAGKYEVTVTDQTVINVTPEKGQAVFAPTITRLAQHQKPIADSIIVFDKVENQYIFSEFWLPGEDGYLVTDTKQPHQHHVLKGTKKKT